MATFKVNKNKNYTVMSNIHLRDPRISLKCKGLLSIMLSLPEEWDYTIRGLASIMKDGESAISAALKELETFGYLTRERQRDENGHVKNIEYNIFEEPIDFDPDNPYPEPPNHSNSPKGENPAQENHPPASQKSKGRKSPKTSMAKGKNQNLSFAKKETEILDLPKQENQGQVNPVQENPVEENRRQINTKTINTKGSSTYPSNPIHQEPRMDEMGLDWIGQKREEIKNQIEFDTLKGQYNEKNLNEIVQIMLDVFVGQKSEIMISGTTYPTAYVQDRLMQIDSMHIQYIFDCLDENPTEIRNIKKYLLAVLFSAPTTIDSYYSAKVHHDLCCGW